MDSDMNESQARDLEKIIKREAPHLKVRVGRVIEVGQSKAWAVYILGLGEPLPIENPSDWEVQKSALRGSPY